MRACFYLNLNEFSVFKLRSVVFLINFPFTYCLAIITCWYKIVPNNPMKGEGYSVAEIEEIQAVILAIREFIRNLLELMQTLLVYLNEVKEQNDIHKNFTLCTHAHEFQAFKHTFFATEGISLIEDKIDEELMEASLRMEESYAATIQYQITNLEEKMVELRGLTQNAINKVMQTIN